MSDAERLTKLMADVARALLEEEVRREFGPGAEVPVELLALLPVDYACLVAEIEAKSPERVAELLAMGEANLRVLLRDVATRREGSPS